MNKDRVTLIIKNIELLVEQLKLEFVDSGSEYQRYPVNQTKKSRENTINIRDLLKMEEYEDPPYQEEDFDDIPNVSVRWKDV